MTRRTLQRGTAYRSKRSGDIRRMQSRPVYLQVRVLRSDRELCGNVTVSVRMVPFDVAQWHPEKASLIVGLV